MQLLIKKAAEMEGEEKEIMVELLANHMKKSYLAWNKDAVDDDKIFMDLKELSKGKIEVSNDLQLTETKAILGKPKKKKQQKRK